MGGQLHMTMTPPTHGHHQWSLGPAAVVTAPPAGSIVTQGLPIGHTTAPVTRRIVPLEYLTYPTLA